MRGKFIVLEGIDGAGKTTQAARLARWLRDQGIPTSLTEEPHKKGAVTPIIRAALHTEGMVPPESLALLFAADRMEHCKWIASLLDAGMWVVCDRYMLSNIVYQSVQNVSVEWLFRINAQAIVPDLTLFLDIDPQRAMQRLESRDNPEIFDRIPTLLTLRIHYQRALRAVPAQQRDTILAAMDADRVHSAIVKSIRARFPHAVPTERTPDGVAH